MSNSRFILALILFALSSLNLHASQLDIHRLFNKTKKVYIIKKEYDLSGDTLVLPEAATVKFTKKGKFINGCIVGRNNMLQSMNKICFGPDIEFDGNFSCDMQYEWLYSSNCSIHDTTLVLYGKEYIVKFAKGNDQRGNIIAAIRRSNGHFTGINFNGNYVIENPDGETYTSHNVIRIKDRLTNFCISGGTFYNAGFSFFDWQNLTIKDMTIYGRYHEYSDREMNLDWTEFHKNNGEELCYAALGIQLTNYLNTSNINQGALVENVTVYNSYNGIYVGSWGIHPKGLRLVENVLIRNCKVHDVIYHGYASCNCHNVIFEDNYAENSYLGMYIDISRGSSNVVCRNGVGKNFPQPFKVAYNIDAPPTTNCTIESCKVTVSSILDNCTLGPSIILACNGKCKVKNNSIYYEDNFGGTLLSIEEINNCTYSFQNNVINSAPFYSFIRYTLSSSFGSEVNIEFEENIIISKCYDSEIYGVIIDDLRQEDANSTLRILINNNTLRSNNSGGCKLPFLKILRRQGYGKFTLHGKLDLYDNLIDYPPYNDVTVDLKQEISF